MRLPANNWRPREYQMPLWGYLEAGGKRAVACWHRRAGKDDVCLHWAGVALHQRIGSYWHMLPMANQVRKAIWDAVDPHVGKRRIDIAFPHELRETTREDQMFIKFKCGSTWQAMGSDNFEGSIGSPPVGLTYSEYAQANPKSWAYLRPILAENGGWSMFISTPRGRNHFEKLLKLAESSPDWFGQRLTVEQTGAIRKEVLEQELRELIREHGKDGGEALYAQEYLCSFDAPNMGSVYGKCMARAETEGRIRALELDPAHPVHTAWDLGYDDATAIWFWQMVGTEVRFIDFFEDHGHGVERYCEVLEERSREKGYRYGKHYVPHDAANKLMAAGGRSIVAQAHALGVNMDVIPATSQQNNIEALRITLDHAWFDVTACADGIDALREYHFEYDEERHTYRNQPDHDWSSHAADAAEIVGRVWRAEKQPKPKPAPRFLEQMTAREIFWPAPQPQRAERI